MAHERVGSERKAEARVRPRKFRSSPPGRDSGQLQPTAASLLYLQRAAGNCAVATMVQRWNEHAPAIGKGTSLTSHDPIPPRSASIVEHHRMQGNPTIQRNLLPVGDHRNWVKAAARHLRDPFTASDNLWIQAIYRALDGVGNPAADKCCEKLIEQRIIDVNDWQILVKDYQLYRSGKGEGFDLHDRHNVPRVHNEEEAGKWVATLITNRIGDLYTTVPGFVGHANQVQLGITQLVSWYQAKLFDEGAYSKFKAEIIKALRVGKAKSALVIPKYVYVFENGSSTAIE